MKHFLILFFCAASLMTLSPSSYAVGQMSCDQQAQILAAAITRTQTDIVYGEYEINLVSLKRSNTGGSYDRFNTVYDYSAKNTRSDDALSLRIKLIFTEATGGYSCFLDKVEVEGAG